MPHRCRKTSIDGMSTVFRASRKNVPLSSHASAGVLPLLVAFLFGVGCSSSGDVKTTVKPDVEQNKATDETLPKDDPSRGMRLVEAVARILAPKGMVPVWVLVNEQGKTVYGVGETPEGWVWQGESPAGPRGNWVGDGSDPIAAIAEWIVPYRVLDGDKVNGIMLKCDPKAKDKLFLIRTDWGVYDEK